MDTSQREVLLEPIPHQQRAPASNSLECQVAVVKFDREDQPFGLEIVRVVDGTSLSLELEALTGFVVSASPIRVPEPVEIVMKDY